MALDRRPSRAGCLGSRRPSSDRSRTDSRRRSSSTCSWSPVAVLDVRGVALREGELLEAVVEPFEPFERGGIRRTVLAEVAAELAPRESDHPAVELVDEMQRDHPRVHEIAEVLVVDAGLEDRLLELRAERMDLIHRGIVGELEDAPRVARVQIWRRHGAHERERGLLLSRREPGAELHRRVDEEEDTGDGSDDVEQDLQLDRHGCSPPSLPAQGPLPCALT